MKLMKRTGIYKGRNVTFNPNTLDAHSYSWWRFVAKIEGKVIFNNYRYSVTTSKHQAMVRHILNDLGIKIDIEMPCPDGLQYATELAPLILQAEETLCNQFLNEELKREERNERARLKRLTLKLEDYLENQVHFRDYEIKPAKLFGKLNIQAVHEVVYPDTLETDVENALYLFQRDGFGKIVFYVGAQ